LTGKYSVNFGKTVYGKKIRKPFSVKTRVPLLSLSSLFLCSLLSFLSRQRWLTTVAWASQIFLSVNLWWPVVGFVDFVVDFGWVVVVGVVFFC
jgi:hypothetical protein